MADQNNLNDKPYSTRVYELDFIKGIGIIGVIIIHFLFFIYTFSDLNLKYLNFPGNSHIGNTIFNFSDFVVFENHFIDIIEDVVRGLFLLIIGITFNFSRNNKKRGIKMLLCAFFLSAFFLIFYSISKESLHLLTFGLLHASSISILILDQIHKKIENKYFYLVFGIIITIIGSYFVLKRNYITYSSLPLHEIIFGQIIGYIGCGADTFPIILVLGVVSIGIFLGKQFYPNKKSLLNLEYKDNIINKIGRNSLYYYLFSYTGLGIIAMLSLVVFTLINNN